MDNLFQYKQVILKISSLITNLMYLFIIMDFFIKKVKSYSPINLINNLKTGKGFYKKLKK